MPSPHEAVERLRKAVDANPGDAEARFQLAGMLIVVGEGSAAVAHLETLLAKNPAQPRVLSHLAAAYASLGQNDVASAICDRALVIPGVTAGELAAIAYTLASVGRTKEAVDAAHRAIASANGSLDVRSRAAGALAHAGHAAEAKEHFAAAAMHRPQDPESWRKLGLASLSSGDWRQAVEAFTRVAALMPRDRMALATLGATLNAAGAREEANAIFQKTLDAGHRDAGVLSVLVHGKQTTCDWEGLDALITELRAKAMQRSMTPAQPQCAMYIETTAKEQRAWAENWARAEFPAMPALSPAPEPRGSRRFRLGYVSGDFHNHATAYLMAGLLEHHDRTRFEVFAYSTSEEAATPERARIAAAVEHFVELRGMPTPAAARRIAEDRLDVLLDMGGYVRNSSMRLAAFRPAPVQGHFLAYPATTGAPFMDFFVADAFVAPPGSEADFTEQILRMPHCYQPNDAKRGDPPAKARAALGLPEDALVLCSFNQAVKFRSAVFAKWCELLEALPGSILWLPDNGEVSNTRLRNFARGRNVDPQRIVFAPFVAQDEHIARLRCADIAIDTFPCTSHTTASDALWAGVPLITTYGETFASRVAASVLRAAGCGDWAFDDPQRAFEATLALARDKRMRDEARARLRSTARTSPLFDSLAYARALESLVERTAQGKPA